MKNMTCVYILLVVAQIASGADAPLELVRSVPLPGVSGRIDHMAVDASGRRLFVAALGNSTVEVVDVAEGRRTDSIAGLDEPQGVAYLAESGRLLVANGGDGTCRMFDGKTLKPVKSVDLGDDADNVRYDAASNRVYVGYGKGAIGILDANHQRVGDIRLPGHPESFQLDQVNRRIFVNVPTARLVAVLDLEKQAVAARWPLPDAKANFPMALDATSHRLFVGCREPARLIALDTRSGQTVGAAVLDADTDDLFLDPELRRIYVSCGAGFLDVFQQSDAVPCRPIARIPTAAGARTCLFVPEMRRLFLAVPHRGQQQAEIRIYAIGPANRR